MSDGNSPDAVAQAPVNECKIFVGNLPYSTSGSDLGKLFEKHGAVVGSKVRSGSAPG